jgi:leucyl aminopeptidase (aminopeptidase T)
VRVNIASASLDFRDLLPKLGTATKVVFFDAKRSNHRQALLEYLDVNPLEKRQFFRVFDSSKTLFETCFRITKVAAKRLNLAVIATAASSHLTVKSSSGTDLSIQLSDRYGWINSCGSYTPGRPGVFPVAEVATYSDAINGVFVADGALNTNFEFPFDARLAKWPIRIEIENSVVRKVDSESVAHRLAVGEMLHVENGNRIGEVGFGTNIGLTSFIASASHINERYPTLHLGLGSNNQGPSRTGWQCGVHLDLIGSQLEIRAGRILLLKNSSYFPELDPDSVDHIVKMGSNTSMASGDTL